ncbi:MAG: vWA domain-containing protein [Candidatus Kapaibacteriota bacterium]|jgi:hypothetical protein
MPSYSFGLIGSAWIMLVLFVVALAFTLITYKNPNPPISNFFRYLLLSLRTFALFLLIMIIFEPILNISKNFIIKPKVAILLDNSLSMGINTEKYNKIETYKSVINKLNLDGLEYKTFTFGNEVKELQDLKFENINLKGQITNITKGLSFVNNNLESENYSCVVLISDGNHNQGISPINLTRELARPIFTIGIGDTTIPKDLSITTLITNKIGFLGAQIPIIVKFTSNGFDNQKTKLKIYENNNLIEEREVVVNKNKKIYEELFTYTPKNEGTNKITATLQAIENELTNANNSSSEFVKITKNKRKFVILAGAPNPDITFVKAELSKVKNVEIKDFIQKNKAEFYVSPTQKDFSESEIIILIGYPNNFSPDNITKMVKNELDLGKSLIFIASKDINYKKATVLEDYLGFKVLSNSPRESFINPLTLEQGLANSVLKIDGNESDKSKWDDLPPLFHSELFVKVNPTATALMNYKISEIEFNEPLLLSNEMGKTKSLVFLGYGLYKWKFGAYTSEKSDNSLDLFNTLMNNSVRWLSVENIGKRFIISTSKEKYNIGETVELLGQVYDKSYNTFDKAKVKVKIQDKSNNKNKETREIILQSISNGKYIGKITGLKSGDYYVDAEAILDGDKIYEKDNTRFDVSINNLEKSNVTLNKTLLSNLADANFGKYYDANDITNLNKDIKNSEFHFDKPMNTKEEVLLWNFPYILSLIILLFSVEWFIRKRLGLL